MSGITKLKLRKNGDEVSVLVLINHPMENGKRINRDGSKVPAHYISTIDFAVNGKVAAQALLGPGVSQNPLVGIMLVKASAGDRVSVNWIDNKGETGSAFGDIT